MFRPKPRVKSLTELNAWLEDQCIAYAQRTKHPEFKERTIWEVFQDERTSLMELRGPFDGFVEKAVRASTTCLIMADHNRYSVDARPAGRMVLVRSHAERIVVGAVGWHAYAPYVFGDRPPAGLSGSKFKPSLSKTRMIKLRLASSEASAGCGLRPPPSEVITSPSTAMRAPFDSHEVKLLRVLTDRGSEFCGNPERHEYELYLAIEDIDHSRTKTKSPQTNGICERFHKTVLNEFYRVAFRKKVYHSIDELQADLDLWVREYNERRPHQGRWCFGKTPMQTFLDAMPMAKEKMIAA